MNCRRGLSRQSCRLALEVPADARKDFCERRVLQEIDNMISRPLVAHDIFLPKRGNMMGKGALFDFKQLDELMARYLAGDGSFEHGNPSRKGGHLKNVCLSLHTSSASPFLNLTVARVVEVRPLKRTRCCKWDAVL